MKTYSLSLILIFTIATVYAQTGDRSAQVKNVVFSINTSQGLAPISPFIYGSNGYGDDPINNIASRRLGSTRFCGYNWENNASNAGEDYFHINDNYLPQLLGVPQNMSNVPGIVQTSFHEQSLALNCISILTLQAAGYVSKDKNGEVQVNETAPSSRFVEVKFQNS